MPLKLRPWKPPKNPKASLRTRRKSTWNPRFRPPPRLGRSCGPTTSTSSETTAYLASGLDPPSSKISSISRAMIQLGSLLRLHAMPTVVSFRTLAAHATVNLFRLTRKPILTGCDSEFHRFTHQRLEFCHSSGITACYRGLGRLWDLEVMLICPLQMTISISFQAKHNSIFHLVSRRCVFWLAWSRLAGTLACRSRTLHSRT